MRLTIFKDSDLSEKFSFYMGQFTPFEKHPVVAVALSGGPDSMALLKLSVGWAQKRKGRVVALHVDHQLRAESTDEAQKVKAWCADWGIECHILTWQHGQIDTRIQERARQGRYALLEEGCRARGILHLLVAHHREDQEETRIMRQEKKSSFLGMAGMSACVEGPFIRILRPLLLCTKAELISFLAGHPFLQDASNKNVRFKRALLRAERQESVMQLDDAAERRLLAEQHLAEDIASYVELHEEGRVTLYPHILCVEREYLLWAHILRTIGGGRYLPNIRQVSLFQEKVKASHLGRATCAGCYVMRRKDNYEIMREYGRVRPITLTSTEPFVWDGRFWVEDISREVIRSVLKPLGEQGWQQVKARVQKINFPFPCRALPALWKDQQVIEVPHLSFLHAKTPLLHLRFRPINAMLGQLFKKLYSKDTLIVH